MELSLLSRQEDLLLDLSQLPPLVESLLAAEECLCDELSLQFVSEEEIAQLHGEFFGDPTTTDCITFPMDQEDDEEGGYRFLGEVFICPAVAKAYVAEQGGNAYEEVSLYIVHGLLHLLGYEDEEEEAEALMRQAENRLMALLRENQLLLRAPDASTAPSEGN